MPGIVDRRIHRSGNRRAAAGELWRPPRQGVVAEAGRTFFDGEGEPPGVGQLVIVIDADAFGSASTIEKFATVAGAIASDDGARIPGRARIARREEVAVGGIKIQSSVYA